MNRNTFAVLSILISIVATGVLIYIGEDTYAGYALLTGFISMVLVTPASKADKDRVPVVGWLVDGVDMSFMNPLSGKYMADVRRAKEHLTNIPGQACKVPNSRVQFLVQCLYKAQGLGGYEVKPPSKPVLYWRKLVAWLNQEIEIPNPFAGRKSSEEEGITS